MELNLIVNLAAAAVFGIDAITSSGICPTKFANASPPVGEEVSLIDMNWMILSKSTSAD